MYLDIFILLSPFIYNILLYCTYLITRFYLKNSDMVINPLIHNYIMVLQSCILLGLVIYDYFHVATIYNISYLDFIQISNKGSSYRQQNNLNWILNLVLLSKLWEWFDTILLIINKKKVINLHWWHHSTITWAFFTGFYTSSFYTIGFLNNIIHIIMYLYYAEVKMIKPYAKYLTFFQIIQLFSGVLMNILSYYYNTEYKYKLFSIINGILCLSYGCMFLQFFNTKYLKSIKNNKDIKHDIKHDIKNDKDKE